MKKERYIITLLLFYIFVLHKSSCSNKKEYIETINSITDTLIVTRNKLKQETASIKVLRFKREKDFLKIKSKDSTILKLQAIIRRYKGTLNTAIKLQNETFINGATMTITKYDTVYIKGIKEIMPIYTTKWNDRWSSGKIIATKDSIYKKIRVKNEYDITIGNIRNKWFKKKEYDIKILNLNPNTYTKELRSYQIKVKPKKINFGVQLGYGVNLLNYKPTIYMGLGINYNIIGIK